MPSATRPPATLLSREPSAGVIGSSCSAPRSRSGREPATNRQPSLCLVRRRGSPPRGGFPSGSRGLADDAPRTDAEHGHDLDAVELGRRASSSSLLADLGEAPPRARPCERRAPGPWAALRVVQSRARQLVQPVEQIARRRGVPPDGAVGPPQLVGVEAQVKLDETADRRRSRRSGSAAPSCDRGSCGRRRRRDGGSDTPSGPTERVRGLPTSWKSAASRSSLSGLVFGDDGDRVCQDVLVPVDGVLLEGERR